MFNDITHSELLEQFVNEPLPFPHHSINSNEWEITGNNNIKVKIDNVVYTYKATYINVETAKDEWQRVSDIAYSMGHNQAYEWCDHIEAQEDFIVANGFIQNNQWDNPAQFEAYWILKDISIENPNLYN